MAIKSSDISSTGTSLSNENVTLLDGQNGVSFEIPLGNFILDAEYARDGQDLVLSDSHGREVVVDGYYTFDPLPSLTNELGASVNGSFVAKLAGPGQIAQAGTTNSSLGEPVGAIETIEGTATVRHTDGTSEPLLIGDEIYKDDVIETGGDGALGILMADGSVVGVGPGSRMTIDNFVYDASSNDGSLGLSFLKGAVSFVSGKIAKNDYDDVDIKVPYGSIGIRGTEFVVDIAEDGTATVSVIQGAVATTVGAAEVVLEPGDLVSLSASGLSTVETISVEAIRARYSKVLDAQKKTQVIKDGREEEGGGEDPAAGTNSDGQPVGDPESTPDDNNPGNNDASNNTDNTQVDLPPQLLAVEVNLNTEIVGNEDVSAQLTDVALSGSIVVTEVPSSDPPPTPDPSFDFTGTDIDDPFTGGPTDDVISGEGGNDTLAGEDGDDSVTGGEGNDSLSGGGGDDTVDGGTGNDTMEGGKGSVDILLGGSGDDLIYGDHKIDLDPTTGDDDTLDGEAGADSLYGGGGDDVLLGGEDNDLLHGGSGSDALDGGSGHDIAKYDGAASDYVISSFAGGFDVTETTTGEVDTLENIEQILFSDGTISLVTFDLSGTDTVAEGSTVSYTVTLNGATLLAGQTASVTLGVTDGTTTGADYTALLTALGMAAAATSGITLAGSTLTFDDTVSSISFDMDATADGIAEGSESFTVTLDGSSSSSGVLAAIDESSDDVLTTITDGDAIEFSITGDASVAEGSSANYLISYSGTLQAGETVSVIVDIADDGTVPADREAFLTALGTAVGGTSGVELSGNELVFDHTANSLSFSLDALTDAIVEGPESFTIGLSGIRRRCTECSYEY